MLDPWIIHEIRRREEEERQQQRPVLELDIEMPAYPSERSSSEERAPEVERGVVIVDFSI